MGYRVMRRVMGSRGWGPKGPWCHPHAQPHPEVGYRVRGWGPKSSWHRPHPHRALASGQHRLPRAGARLLAPISDPEKVICVGLNYRDHCLEQDVKVPKEPLIFSKFPSAIVGPFDDIVHPAESSVSAPQPPPRAPCPVWGGAAPLQAPICPPGGGLGGGAGCGHREDGAAHPGNGSALCFEVGWLWPCHLCHPPSIG